MLPPMATETSTGVGEEVLGLIRALALELHPGRRGLGSATLDSSLERDFGLEGLEAGIRSEHQFTPLDFLGQLNAFLGSAFSIEPVLTQSAYFRPHNRSEDVDGLYLAGAGTHPGAGLPGTLLSAEIVERLIATDVPLVSLARGYVPLAHSEV